MDASIPAMALAHFASGALGAGMATVTTQPLDNAVVRSQLSRILRKEGHTISLSGAESDAGQGYSKDDSIAALLAREGGLALPSVGRMLRESDVGRRGLEAGVFFGVYALLKGARAGVYGSSTIPAVEELGLGLLSGAVGRGIGIGVSNVFLSPDSGNSCSPHRGGRGRKGGLKGSLRRFRVKHVLASVDDTINGIFRGYFSGGFVRGAVEPGITLAIEQILARLLLSSGRKRGILDVFVLAVVGKMIATLATYPFRTARARMVVARSKEVVSGLGGETANGNGRGTSMNTATVEDEKLIDLSDNERVVLGEENPFADNTQPHSQSQAEEKERYDSVFEAMRHVYRTEGVIALYDGVGSEIFRAVVHHVTLMVGKELVHRFILRSALAVVAFWNRKMMVTSAKVATSADSTIGMMRTRPPIPTVPKVPTPTMKPVSLLDNSLNQAQPAAAPAALPRIRSLHTGQYIPMPGERPWDIQQQTPTVRLAPRYGGETNVSKLLREKPWNLQQGATSDFGDRLRDPKPLAPKWTEMLPALPWRKKPVDDETGSLVTNMLGDGSRRV